MSGLRHMQWCYLLLTALLGSCGHMPEKTEQLCQLPPPETNGAVYCVCTHSGWLCTARLRAPRTV